MPPNKTSEPHAGRVALVTAVAIGLDGGTVVR
jgi:hypothetical protein